MAAPPPYDFGLSGGGQPAGPHWIAAWVVWKARLQKLSWKRDRRADHLICWGRDNMADTLYARLGGYDAIAAVAENLLSRFDLPPVFWTA